MNSASTASMLTQDLNSPSQRTRVTASNNISKTQDSRRADDNAPVTATMTTTALGKTTSSSTARGLDGIQNYHSVMKQEEVVSVVDDESLADSRQFHEDEDVDGSVDESTLCPTIVAEDRKPSVLMRGYQGSNGGDHKEHDRQYHPAFAHNVIKQPASLADAGNIFKETVLSPEIDLSRRSIFRKDHDISLVHVLVASPSETFLTSDATVLLNDVDALSQSSQLVNDAASLGEETPVLDRYRIISDDNSIGFKVLPNARGSNRKTKRGNRLTSHVEDEGSMPKALGVPKSVKFHEPLEDEMDHQSFRKTPYPASDTSLLHNSSNSHLLKGSTFISIPSPFRYELDKENRKVVFSDPHSQGEAISSFSCGRRTQIPKTPSSISKPMFRKTPYRASDAHVDDEDQIDKGKGIGTLTDATVRFDIRTPLKDTAPPYRKTPRPKITERLSMESLKFHSSNRNDTPAPGDRMQLQKAPHADNNRANGNINQTSRPAVRFEDDSEGVASSALLRESKTLQKTPYYGSLNGLGDFGGDHHNGLAMPVNAGTPKMIRFNTNDDMMTSPASLASDITGLTAMSYSVNQRELFPAIESLEDRNAHALVLPLNRSRKSTSSLIAKVGEEEFEDAAPLIKLQFSLDETNRAIAALNGAAFLRKDRGGISVRFTDAEAYKILRNVGFKRRRCKGLLMSLCHLRRLSMNEEETAADFGLPTHYFEIIQCGERL